MTTCLIHTEWFRSHGKRGQLMRLNSLFSFLLSFSLITGTLTPEASANLELPITYAEALERFESSVFYKDLREALEVVKENPTQAAYEVLTKRVEALFDLDLRSQRKDFTGVVMLLLDSLMYVGSKEDIPLVLEVHKWAATNGLSNKILDKTTDVIETLDRITPGQRLKTLNLNPVQLGGHHQSIDHRLALKEVSVLMDAMKKEARGQDQVLNAFADLYMKDLLLSGRRIGPELIYLMGLPGNGKDTVTEAYVKAMWQGSKKALTDHLFRMNIRSNQESWTYFGSPKGYIGSGELPDFLKFLVENSGGKYILAKTPENGQAIEHNPDWKGENLPDFAPPEKAVIFVNEFHNVPKSVKDDVLKQAIERGIFKIVNPGNTDNSAPFIELPMTFVFATNEGINLIEPREKNGARIGPPLPYEKLIENYDRVADDKESLKQAIITANGEINDPSMGKDAPGTSEEFLDRIPDNRLFIMKPLSADILVQIAGIKIRKASETLYNANGRLGHYQIEVDEALIKFIQTYKYIPSRNARPIEGRVENFIFNQIYQAIRIGKIRSLGVLQQIHISLKEYSNGARAVVFYIVEPNSGLNYQFTRIIPETLKDRVNKPLSDERIVEISDMRQSMLDNVFGVEHIVDALVESVLVAESETLNSDSERPATVMAFLGMTSTGKTETAKQFVKGRMGDEERPVIIDFNKIQSVEAMESKILGSVDGRKNPIDSDFMKAYDRANGKIVFIFDEAANAPKELLKALYEVLREKVVTGFSDGKPRPMKEVTIILTGNAGEQIYRNIPTNLPTALYERALHEMFKIFIKNEDLQRQILKESFPDALLARLGQNIFHFGPLSHAGKRQIAQLKLMDELKKLEPKPSERGWGIKFKDETNLLRLFALIEQDGFDHHSQGASIDKFVRESVIGKMKSRLLFEKVPSGEEVIIEVSDKTISEVDLDLTRVSRVIYLTLEDGRRIQIDIPVGSPKVSIKKNDVDQVLTAYHEAGHEIVSEVFFGDRLRAKYLSVIEGVTIIGGDFVHYAGVRVGEEIERTELTKEVILRRAAVLAGGYIAQGLVTIGGRHDAGKNDDMKRSTHLIQDAILRYGLSKEWGMRGISNSMSTEDYISKTLSSNEKEKLNALTNRWLKEAAQLAREALLANSQRLLPAMGKELASTGYVDADGVYALYEDNNILTERDGEVYRDRAVQIRYVIDQINAALEKHGSAFDQIYTDLDYTLARAPEAYDFLMKKQLGLMGYIARSPWSKLTAYQQRIAGMYLTSRVSYDSRDAKLSSPEWMPAHVASIVKIIEGQRLSQTQPVTQNSKFKIVGVKGTEPKLLSFSSAGSCQMFLEAN